MPTTIQCKACGRTKGATFLEAARARKGHIRCLCGCRKMNVNIDDNRKVTA